MRPSLAPSIVRGIVPPFAGTPSVPRGATAAFIIRIVGAGLAFASQVLLARWMGGHAFGIYSSVAVVVAIAGSLCVLGFGSAALQFIPAYVAKAETGTRRRLHASRRVDRALRQRPRSSAHRCVRTVGDRRTRSQPGGCAPHRRDSASGLCAHRLLRRRRPCTAMDGPCPRAPLSRETASGARHRGGPGCQCDHSMPPAQRRPLRRRAGRRWQSNGRSSGRDSSRCCSAPANSSSGDGWRPACPSRCSRARSCCCRTSTSCS